MALCQKRQRRHSVSFIYLFDKFNKGQYLSRVWSNHTEKMLIGQLDTVTHGTEYAMNSVYLSTYVVFHMLERCAKSLG